MTNAKRRSCLAMVVLLVAHRITAQMPMMPPFFFPQPQMQMPMFNGNDLSNGLDQQQGQAGAASESDPQQQQGQQQKPFDPNDFKMSDLGIPGLGDDDEDEGRFAQMRKTIGNWWKRGYFLPLSLVPLGMRAIRGASGAGSPVAAASAVNALATQVGGGVLRRAQRVQDRLRQLLSLKHVLKL